MKNTAIAEVQGIEAPLLDGVWGTNPYTVRNYLAEKTGKKVELEFIGDCNKHKDAKAVIVFSQNNKNSDLLGFGSGAHYVTGINNGDGTFRWYNEYDEITDAYGNNLSIPDREKAMDNDNRGHLGIIAVYDDNTGGGFR